MRTLYKILGLSAFLFLVAGSAYAVSTLQVQQGGTGANTFTQGDLLQGNGTSALSSAPIYATSTGVSIGTTTIVSLLNVAGTTTATNLVDAALTSGDCVQASAGGLLTTVSGACGAASYTFSTGLTNTSGTVTSNLSTGVSGGQSVIGGTGPTDSLSLQSTSGVGATGATIKLLGGQRGCTQAMTILNNGNVGIGTTGTWQTRQIPGPFATQYFVFAW